MSQLKRMLISIGSNNFPEDNMIRAKKMMENLFTDIKFSKDVWTEPIGLNSEKFMNCVAQTYTYHGLKQVSRALKQIEHKCGRKKPETRNGLISMDIDILLFGSFKLHEEDWNRPYISELIDDINNLK